MPLGKAIQLFLIDGNASGRVACELFNWTGKAYKIPRKQLKSSSEREELYKAGVYFLFGRGESDSEINVAYIGEAEEVYPRLTQQLSKDFWNEALVFISKDENLNKAHVKYLEYSAYEAARTAGRTALQNSNTPSRPAISETERSVMKAFFGNLKLLTGTLGYKIFEPLSEPEQEKTSSYFIEAARGAKARAVVTNEGIVVKEGSEAALPHVPSTPGRIVALRDKLVSSGVIAEEGETLRFTRDYLFPSPSTAAAVVMGRSANGRVEWKDEQGRALKASEE